MAYTLNTEELAHVANGLGLTAEVNAVQSSINALSAAIAEKLGVVAPPQQGLPDGYATFEPATQGQPIPAALKDFDNDEEWEDE